MKKFGTLLILSTLTLAACGKKKDNGGSKTETVTLYAAPAVGTWSGSSDKATQNGAVTQCQSNYRMEQLPNQNRLELVELHVKCANGRNWVAPAQDWYMINQNEVPASVDNAYGSLPSGAYALVESSGLGRAKIRGWITQNGHELGLKTPTFDLELKTVFLEKGKTPLANVTDFKVYGQERTPWLVFPSGLELVRGIETVDRRSWMAYPLAATELGASQSSNAKKLLCQDSLDFHSTNNAFAKIDFEGSSFQEGLVRVKSALRGNGFERVALVESGVPTISHDKDKGIYRVFVSLRDASGFTHRLTVQTTNFTTARVLWKQDGADRSEESLCYFLAQ